MKIADRATINMIEQELSLYPVDYSFDRGGKLPFVKIRAAGGREARVSFSAHPNGKDILNVRGDIRRKLRSLGVEPRPDRKREARLGSLGEAIVGAAVPFEAETETPATGEPMAHANGNVVEMKPADEKSKEAPQYQKLTRSEIIFVTRIITCNADIDDKNKVVTYVDGWTDERVLAILKMQDPTRTALSIKHIETFRRENFGRTKAEIAASEAMRAAKAPKALASIEDRLAALDARVTALEEAATK